MPVPPLHFKRHLELKIQMAAARFPAVTLTGPRHSGKTSLAKMLFGQTHRYLSLDDPYLSDFASNAPVEFFESNPPPLILDEIQHAPILLHYIKEMIDNNRRAAGQFIIISSENVAYDERVTQSLTGRTAIFRLNPLRGAEIINSEYRSLPWDIDDAVEELPTPHRPELWSQIFRGGYPELIAHPEVEASSWYENHIREFLKRDVCSWWHVNDAKRYLSFLQALARQSADILDIPALAREIGVPQKTIKHWIMILEATFQITPVLSFAEGLNTGIAGKRKIYFTDTGTLCYLLGLTDPIQAASSSSAGKLFETAVIDEILYRQSLQSVNQCPQFWQTASGDKVELLLIRGGRYIPISIRHTEVLREKDSADIKTFTNTFGSRAEPGYILHSGTAKQTLASGVTTISFAEF